MSTKQNPNVVGVYDAKTHFAEILERAAHGQEIIITKHGTPVAKLVPMKKAFSLQERLDAIERIKTMRRGHSLGGLKIKDLIREGRR
jgi:prevent-host-death family protein